MFQDVLQTNSQRKTKPSYACVPSLQRDNLYKRKTSPPLHDKFII